MSSANQLPICRHVKINGVRCKNPALRSERYCYFHHRTLGRGARLARLQNPMPLLEDANAIQVAIFRIINAILDGSLDSKKACAILYALQTASLNLKRVNLSPYWRDVVLEDEDDPHLEDPRPAQRAATALTDDGSVEVPRKFLPLASEQTG